jgi:hypothetical protein
MSSPDVTPIETLASLIQSPDRYGFEWVVKGLRAERDRLGSAPYLTTFWISDMGYDGFTDSIGLGDSYTNSSEAIAHSDNWLSSARDGYLQSGRASWTIEPEKGLSPTLRIGEGVGIYYQKSLGLAGGRYDHVYLCARVLGPFQGWIVEKPLMDFFAETKNELRSFLMEVSGWRPDLP